jgi:hypothetical protein
VGRQCGETAVGRSGQDSDGEVEQAEEEGGHDKDERDDLIVSVTEIEEKREGWREGGDGENNNAEVRVENVVEEAVEARPGRGFVVAIHGGANDGKEVGTEIPGAEDGDNKANERSMAEEIEEAGEDGSKQKNDPSAAAKRIT